MARRRWRRLPTPSRPGTLRQVKPLEGIRVLDASRVVSGPVCCWILAALGAEVIRVEAPGGDLTWLAPPFAGPDGVHRGARGERDIGLSPLRKGRGKRSVVLDIKTSEGLAVFKRLVGVCDVLVENFVPGQMDALGLADAELERLNPRLVHCSITGYGHDGPYRDRSAMDLVVQAMSGIMAKTGFPDGPPTKVGATIGDQVPSLFGALGIVAALRQRDRDGRGQKVDVAMLDALLTLMWDEPLDEFEERGIPERVGNGDPRGSPLGVFRTTDGWIALVVTNDEQWRQIAELMGLDELYARCPTHGDRASQRDEVNGAVASWCSAHRSDEVLERLLAFGVPAGPVQGAFSARHDPHVAHRGALEPLRHPDLLEPTPWLGPALPIRLSRADTGTAPAEPLGASTEAVLRELLGADDAELARLRASGALGST
jgi:crotonobetainyl-CoA:carnitine CoA-transferase CaiB-like acyl-CoA transferase